MTVRRTSCSLRPMSEIDPNKVREHAAILEQDLRSLQASATDTDLQAASQAIGQCISSLDAYIARVTGDGGSTQGYNRPPYPG